MTSELRVSRGFKIKIHQHGFFLGIHKLVVMELLLLKHKLLSIIPTTTIWKNGYSQKIALTVSAKKIQLRILILCVKTRLMKIL